MQGSHVVEMFPSSAAHYPIAKFPRHFATVLLLIDDLLDVIKSLWWLVFSQNACDLERKNKNSCELHQKKTNINDAKTRPKEVEKQTDPDLVCASRASISCSLSISEKPLAPKIARSSLAFDTYIVYPPVHEGVPHHLAPTWSCRLLWHVSSWALLAPLELALQVQILIQSNLTRPQPIFRHWWFGEDIRPAEKSDQDCNNTRLLSNITKPKAGNLNRLLFNHLQTVLHK